MQLKKINEVLSEDYQCRRQMMIKRFQVTLESFAWGEKHKVGMLNNCICDTKVGNFVVSWGFFSVICFDAEKDEILNEFHQRYCKK